jgi:hypothetical protein
MPDFIAGRRSQWFLYGLVEFREPISMRCRCRSLVEQRDKGRPYRIIVGSCREVYRSNEMKPKIHWEFTKPVSR